MVGKDTPDLRIRLNLSIIVQIIILDKIVQMSNSNTYQKIKILKDLPNFIVLFSDGPPGC